MASINNTTILFVQSRIALIAIFTLAIALSATIVLQLPMQAANAKMFYDPITGYYKDCPPGYYYEYGVDLCILA